jgi:hypothetical protein
MRRWWGCVGDQMRGKFGGCELKGYWDFSASEIVCHSLKQTNVFSDFGFASRSRFLDCDTAGPN